MSQPIKIVWGPVYVDQWITFANNRIVCFDSQEPEHLSWTRTTTHKQVSSIQELYNILGSIQAWRKGEREDFDTEMLPQLKYKKNMIYFYVLNAENL